MGCNIYYLIWYSYAILQHKNSNFSRSNDLYSCAIFWKKSDLNFVFMRNFVQKKKYLFRINAQFRAKLVSYWYENYAKFRAKKSFRAKPRNCCTRESTVSWKPYFWETEGPRAAISLLMLTSSLYSEWGFAV